MADVDFVTDAKKKHDVPLDHLDFKYVEKCENVKELEKIYRILASGVEGKYPDLENFVFEKIKRLSPNSRVLRKDIPIYTKQALSKTEQEFLDKEILNFVNEIPSLEKKLTNISENSLDSDKDTVIPPIRSVRQSNIISSSKQPSSKPTETSIKAETINTKKSVKPKDYREWEKIEKQIDKELEEKENSNELISKVSGDKTVVNHGKNLSKALVKDLPKDEKYFSNVDLDETSKTLKADQEKCKGNESYAAGCYQEAVTYYTRSIKYLPNSASYNNRALAYIKLEEWDKAIQDCNEVLKYEKDNIKALLRRATAYHKRKNYEKAKIDIEKCLVLDPNDKKAIELHKKINDDHLKHIQDTEKVKSSGGNRLKIEETDGSDEESNEEVEEIKETKVEERKRRIAIQEVDYDESESEEEMEKSQSTNGKEKISEHVNMTVKESKTETQIKENVKENLTQVNIKTEEKQEIQEPKKIYKLPEAVLKTKDKATELFSNGQYGEAVEYYTKSIDMIKNSKASEEDIVEINKNLSVLYNNRASCYQHNCDYKNCIIDCENGLSLVNDNISLKCKLLFKKANALEMSEKYEESYFDYETLMKIDSKFKNVQSNYNRVRNILNQNGKLDKIRNKMNIKPIETNLAKNIKQEEKIEEKPKEPVDADKKIESDNKQKLFDEYKMKGNDYVKLNNYEKACEFYSKCIEIDPSNPIAYSNRSLCYIKMNNPDMAIKDATFVLDNDANNVKALYRRALAYKEKKNYILSVQDLNKILSIEANNQIAKSELNEIQNLIEKAKKDEKLSSKVLIKEVETESKPEIKIETKTQTKPIPVKKEIPQNTPILNIQNKTYDFTSITNAYEFLQAWNSINPKDIDSYANLISNVDPKQLYKFIGSKLDDDMLTKLIKCVHKLANEKSNLIENKYTVDDYLESITKTQRFEVTKLFISKEQKLMLNEMFDKSTKGGQLKKLYLI